MRICNSDNKKDANINTNSKRAKSRRKMRWDGLGKIGASARGQRGHLLCRWCGQSEKEGRAELRDGKGLKEKKNSLAKENTKLYSQDTIALQKKPR